MQSIIVSSKDTQKRKDYSATICKEQGISPFDITVLEQEKSIGIEDIRNVQKSVYLKPYKGDKKAVIIRDGQTITHQAQNALLKVLEEPPQDTIIILETDKPDSLLPTICSRCTIIQLDTPIDNIEHLPQDLQALAVLVKASIGEKLKLAQDMGKSKESALQFLEQAIITSHSLLLEQIANGRWQMANGKLLQSLQHSYTLISTTNVTPRFALEILFLSL